jgi:hypothetical protein
MVAAATAVVARQTPRIENISALLSRDLPERAAQSLHEQDGGQISRRCSREALANFLGKPPYCRDTVGRV